jgi:hypothetical protein
VPRFPVEPEVNDEAASGERALEGGSVGWPAGRRQHELDRQLEQWAKPRGDLVSCHAVSEPLRRDLETSAEVVPWLTRLPVRVRSLPVPQTRPQLAHGAMLRESGYAATR